jgi:hypothetical protein
MQKAFFLFFFFLGEKKMATNRRILIKTRLNLPYIFKAIRFLPAASQPKAGMLNNFFYSPL